MTSQVERWVAKLDAMAAHEIAELFRTEKVTGTPGDSRRCPIANFLRNKTDACNIMTSGHGVVWDEKARSLWTGAFRVRTLSYDTRIMKVTGGIREFVKLFDSGEFKDLRGPRTPMYPPVSEISAAIDIAMAAISYKQSDMVKAG
jgi:hypothetical protein